MSKRIIFMGSPAFAVPSLRALHTAGHTIDAVYSQPPRPAGRGQQLQKTPVHQLAESLGIPVFTPLRLKGDDLETLLATPVDALCVVAYGLLLPKVLVESRTCLNVHPSSLPHWRGPAPLQHTLINGDSSTEICIMKLDEGMDTGPVYTRIPLPVPADMTLGTLHDTCATIGATALCEVLATLETRTPTPQTGTPTLAPKIKPEDRILNFSQSATALHNRIRGLSPAPGATAVLAGETVKIHAATPLPTDASTPAGTVTAITPQGIHIACGQGTLCITHLQRPGGKPLPAAEAARGWPTLQSHTA